MKYYEGTNLVPRDTLEAMIGNYTKATEEITEAYALLRKADGRLQSSFLTHYFEVIRRNGHGIGEEEVAEVLKGIERRAWSDIVDRLELRKLLSIKRREELDAQLSQDRGRYNQWNNDPPPPLPPISEANVLAMFQDVAARAPDYAREAVSEVFDWLRPHHGHTAEMKTNQAVKWQLGKKVILGSCVQLGYKNGYRVNYHREANLIALDNVIHMLDGKGVLKSHSGPLCDAINATGKDGLGKTDYFKFKCCKNGNLHLEMKRMDLVNKINVMAGGNQLKDAA